MPTQTPEEALKAIRDRKRSGSRQRPNLANDGGIPDPGSNARGTDGNIAARDAESIDTTNGIRIEIDNSGNVSRGQVDSTIGPGSNGYHGDDTEPTGSDTDSLVTLYQEVDDKPIGLDFDDTDDDISAILSEPIPAIPPKSARRNRKDEQIAANAAYKSAPASVQSIENRPSLSDRISGILPGIRSTPGVPVQTVTQAAKHIPATITTNKETEELRKDVEALLFGAFSLADAFREAYLKTHPKAKEGNGLFTLKPDDLEQGTEWVLRRTQKSPKIAGRVRTIADLYDSYAVPVAIVFPRMKQFIREIREQGVNIRGR